MQNLAAEPFGTDNLQKTYPRKLNVDQSHLPTRRHRGRQSEPPAAISPGVLIASSTPLHDGAPAGPAPRSRDATDHQLVMLLKALGAEEAAKVNDR